MLSTAAAAPSAILLRIHARPDDVLVMLARVEMRVVGVVAQLRRDEAHCTHVVRHTPILLSLQLLLLTNLIPRALDDAAGGVSDVLSRSLPVFHPASVVL